MANEQPGAEWHWDGNEWWWWDGHEWVEAGVANATPPPLPPAEPTIPGPPTAPPPQSVVTSAALVPQTPAPRSGLSTGGWLAIGLGILLALVLVGGGLGFVLTRDSDDVVTLQTEPISAPTANPFTTSVGTDTPVTPVKTAALQTVPAQEVGIFGGTMNQATCNKSQLVSYLQANPSVATIWAGVFNIAPASIPAFVEPLTPVLLRSDTAVTNHGLEKGKLTTYPAVLQAGTAVMVDQFGTPVVKCSCGNPLTAPPKLNRVKYKGTQWPQFESTGLTIIQASPVVISQFVIVNVTNNTLIVRPTGTDGAADTPGDGTPTDDFTTDGYTAPPAAPVAPTPVNPPTVEEGRGDQAIAMVQDRYRSCAAVQGESEGVEEVIQGATYDVAPEGGPGWYIVLASDSSGGFEYRVNVDTGVVIANNGPAQEVASYCPGVWQ